jgi:hypothetical protein
VNGQGAKDSDGKRTVRRFGHENCVYPHVCTLFGGHLKFKVLAHGICLGRFFWLGPLSDGYFKLLDNIRDLLEML